MSAPAEAIRKICIRTPNHLGDLLMSTAFVGRVLEKYPLAQVDLVVKQGLQTLPLPHRGQILPFSKSPLAPLTFGWSLRRHNYDLFFVLPPSFSAGLMAKASHAKLVVGHTEPGRSWLLDQAKAYSAPPRTRHLVEEYFELLGESMAGHLPRLQLTPGWVAAELAGVALPERFIALTPGAVYGPAKQWPADYWQELADKLVRLGETPVALGMQGDWAGEAVPGLVDLTGKTNLTQLVAVLSRARLLISNDSGAMHLMAALQKPQIALFGSTSETWTGPLNPLAKLLHLHLPCSPCFSRECQFGHTNCLRGISPDLVLTELRRMEI